MRRPELTARDAHGRRQQRAQRRALFRVVAVVGVPDRSRQELLHLGVGRGVPTDSQREVERSHHADAGPGLEALLRNQRGAQGETELGVDALEVWHLVRPRDVGGIGEGSLRLRGTAQRTTHVTQPLEHLQPVRRQGTQVRGQAGKLPQVGAGKLVPPFGHRIRRRLDRRCPSQLRLAGLAPVPDPLCRRDAGPFRDPML